MTELILDCKLLVDIADIVVIGVERIKKEASKNRMTFKNGCEYRIFSAYGEGFSMMGFGADVIVIDEAGLIGREAYAKILRMLGDNPENAVLIELYNPWDRDTKAFDHSADTTFDVMRIDYRVGIEEGRTTSEFIEEQRKEITPLEFTVLYESKFPEESEDSLYNLSKIELAENKNFGFDSYLNSIKNKLQEKITVEEKEKLTTELKKFIMIIACDPADKGLDETVLYWGILFENKFQLVGFYSEPKTEQTQLVGKIMEITEDFIGSIIRGKIFLDRIGIGAGPLSFLKQELSLKGYKNVHVTGCHFGESASKPDHFINKKAENYFRSRDIFNEELIQIPKIRKLRTQLLAMKWELTSSGKKKIIDPEGYSPDWCDALCYFTWKDKAELVFSF